MKVLFLIDTINGSGAEKSLVEIALNFNKYTPVFVHIYGGEMLKPTLEANQIKVYSLNITGKYGYADAVKKLIPIYKSEKPKIVHSTLFRSDIIARKLKLIFPNIPLVGSFVSNAYSPTRYVNKSLLMKLKLYFTYLQDLRTSKHVDFFISNSDTIKKVASTKLKIAPNNIQVIHRGRDVNKFNNIDALEINSVKDEFNLHNKNVLLIVSRLIKSKGQKDVITALPKILATFPNTVLLLAGHGAYRQQLENKINELSLNDDVILLGRRHDIPILLATADLFIFPSYSEGLPGALIEAMMAEKIIITSNIEENLECVSEESAIFFKAGNISQIEDKIIYALNNINELKTLALEAKQKAIRDFDINNISNSYENVYDKIINKT